MPVTVKVEIASTFDKLAQGLMFRKSMPENEGMLFKFHQPIMATFWGKNTYIPLDIAFISKDGTVINTNKIAPMSTRMIHSNDLCKYAVEVNSGFFDKHGIKSGSKVVVDENTGEVKFVLD